MKNFLAKYFGPKKPAKLATRALGPIMQSVSERSLHLVPSKAETRSFLGGASTLRPPMESPLFNGKPLPLVAQIDLGEVQKAQSTPWLPHSGTLSFFYDVFDQSIWGFDPEDRSGSAVVYSPNISGNVSHIVRSNDGLARIPVHFVPRPSYPSSEREIVSALALNSDEIDAWYKIESESFGGHPRHQMFGFPSNIQGDDMELECQLVSNGIYCGDSSGYESIQAKEFEPGKTDWRLLLQVDSDEDGLGVMWGDAGALYYWIREQDATARRFDKAWMIFQCH